MTEKRFNYDYKTGRICDNESPVQNTKNPRHWVTRLNDIDSECKKIKKENEQLEKTNQKLYDKLQNVTSLESLKIGETTKLERENKRLRSILRIYRKIASCQNCDYHDYDWYNDGDEFEVCEKGHDMSESICKDWREL